MTSILLTQNFKRGRRGRERHTENRTLILVSLKCSVVERWVSPDFLVPDLSQNSRYVVSPSVSLVYSAFQRHSGNYPYAVRASTATISTQATSLSLTRLFGRAISRRHKRTSLGHYYKWSQPLRQHSRELRRRQEVYHTTSTESLTLRSPVSGFMSRSQLHWHLF